MKQTSRVYFDFNSALSNPLPKPAPIRVKSTLKALSTKTLWILIESIENQLYSPKIGECSGRALIKFFRHSLSLSPSQIKAMEKRLRDLNKELDHRLEYEDWLCDVEDMYNPLHLDKAVEACRRKDLDPPRRSSGKVFVQGRRLRPGKKTSYMYKIKK